MNRCFHALIHSVFFFAASSALADAQMWSFATMKKDAGKFLLGFSAGIAAHEMGHVLVAKSKGYNVSIDGTTIIYPGSHPSQADAIEVSSAGFQAQWIASEIAFQQHKLRSPSKKMGNISAGIIFAHIAISATYLTVLKDHPDGDIHGIAESADISRNLAALSVAVPALLDTWRLFSQDVPEWVPRASIMSKGLMISYSWHF